MPLKAGTGQETISSNIKETLGSPTFGPGKPKKKRRQMAVAAAMQKAGKSRKSNQTLSQAATRRKRK